MLRIHLHRSKGPSPPRRKAKHPPQSNRFIPKQARVPNQMRLSSTRDGTISVSRDPYTHHSHPSSLPPSRPTQPTTQRLKTHLPSVIPQRNNVNGRRGDDYLYSIPPETNTKQTKVKRRSVLDLRGERKKNEPVLLSNLALLKSVTNLVRVSRSPFTVSFRYRNSG